MDSLKSIAEREFGEISISTAFITHNIGMAFSKVGFTPEINGHEEAISYYQRAISIRDQLLLDTADLKLIQDNIRGYNNIGSRNVILNRPYRALESLNKAMELLERYDLVNTLGRFTTTILTATARSLREIGDYENALKYYSNIVNYVDQLAEPSNTMKVFKIRALIEGAFIKAYVMNLTTEARSDLLFCIAELGTFKTRRSQILLANANRNLGITYLLDGELDSSISILHSSLSFYKGHDIRNYGLSCFDLGVAFKRKGLLDSSSFYFKEGKQAFLELNDQSKLPFYYDNIGDVEFELGNYVSSLNLDNLALEELIPDFDSKSVSSVPILDSKVLRDKVTTLISLQSKATTLLYLYHLGEGVEYLKSAYQHFKVADQVITLMRSEYIADASKVNLVDRAKPIYEKALEACWELYQIQPTDSVLSVAFEFAEKSKSIILQDAVRRTKAKSRVEPKLITSEKENNLKVNYYEKQVALTKGKGNADINYLDSLLLYRRKRDAIVEEIRDNHPEYYQSIFGRSTVSPKQVQSSQDPDQGFIEYFMGDSSIFCFVITQDTILFTKSRINFDKEEWGRTFSKDILAQDQSFMENAYAMYQTLIEPIKSAIDIPTKITIVPDDVLGTISFDALITKMPSSERIYFPDFKDYLLFDHQISYAFSATTLFESGRSQTTKGNSFLGISPHFESGFTIGDSYFQGLEWNQDEVYQVGDLFGQRRILDENVSVDLLHKEAKGYDIIHLATHAEANHENGNLSYILLGDEKSSQLFVNDLYAIDLNANMTVLSACQTGTGPINRGEGVISLARGFVYAGSSSVITSLWSVREQANNKIIIDFYQGLETGLSKDEALRNAKVNFLSGITREDQVMAHPYFWAALICIGDTSPYIKSVSLDWKVYGLILVAIVAFFYFRNRRFKVVKE